MSRYLLSTQPRTLERVVFVINSCFLQCLPHGLCHSRYLGSAVAMVVVPYMTHILGPQAGFRVSGLLALAWAVIWWNFGSDNTEDISDTSLDDSITQVDEAIDSKKADPTPLLSRHDSSSTVTLNGRRSPPDSAKASLTDSKKGDIPWVQLFKSSAVWAIIVNNFAFHYGTYVLMNWLPTYFGEYIGVPLNDLGGSYKVNDIATFPFDDHQSMCLL